MTIDETVAKTEGEAVAKLIADVNPTLYADIEDHATELKEVTAWLVGHNETEDINIANLLIINRNKKNRLAKELDALLATKDDLEFKGLEFHRKSGEVEVSEKSIVVFKKLLSTLDNIDQEHLMYLPEYLVFKSQVEAELSRNRVVIEHFNKFTLTNSPFNITK